MLFGVETRDFDKVEIPIEDRFLFMAFCLILAADRRSGVDLTFWTLLNFGVFAASFYNKNAIIKQKFSILAKKYYENEL